MQYIYSTTQIAQRKESVVVLGNFDGVHIGHQRLFDLAREKADHLNLQVVALSFYPHPTWVLGSHPKPLIMSRKDKKNKLKAIGVDVFIEYPFDIKFANISPDIFFSEILVKQLKARVIVVGSNYYFGKNKKGDIGYMKKLGQQYNAEICVVNTIKTKGAVVSSTHIRNLVEMGAVQEVGKFLGHPYTIVGTVVHGKKLGRTLGFPTINIIADPDRVHPPNGVYATSVKVYDKEYMGITNIGYNPTVNGSQKMIETHIFNFDESIYGTEVEVSFYAFIRPEKKFASLDELVAQMMLDKEKARFLLKEDINCLQV